MAENHFGELIGMEMVELEGGDFEVRLNVEARHSSPAMRVHGGVFFSMIDTAMGHAVISTIEEGRGCATIEAKINYFRPVQRGWVRATARCTNLSRRTAYTEAEIRDEEERLIARATGTFMLTDSVQQVDREDG